MQEMFDNYFDYTRPGMPYTHSHPAPDGAFPASNAAREATKPTAPKGFHPCWAPENGPEKKDEWVHLENHIGKQGYVDGEPYTIKEYGPLPKGWSDTPTPLTPEEQAEQARAMRDGLLAATDALVLVPDISDEFREKVLAYRQALRDVPSQPGFPENIAWPERP